MLTFCPTWKVQHALLTSTEDSPHRKIKLFTVRQYSEQLTRCSLDHFLITSEVVFHIYIIQSDWTVESSQSSSVFIAQNWIKTSCCKFSWKPLHMWILSLLFFCFVFLYRCIWVQSWFYVEDTTPRLTSIVWEPQSYTCWVEALHGLGDIPEQTTHLTFS